MGDECMSCEIPDGWEPVEQCPEDFIQVSVDTVCEPHKSPFCCTVGHSGASGDCGDVVVNDFNRLCAFAEDISECAMLPADWMPANESNAHGLCPPDYVWEDEPLECLKKGELEDITDRIDKDIIDPLLGILAGEKEDAVSQDKETHSLLPLMITGVALILMVAWIQYQKKKI
jgi:hypothetical protein